MSVVDIYRCSGTHFISVLFVADYVMTWRFNRHGRCSDCRLRRWDASPFVSADSIILALSYVHRSS